MTSTRLHGILDALGVPDGEVVGAQILPQRRRRPGGRCGCSAASALWTMTHLAVPSLADYKERHLALFRRSRSSNSNSLALPQLPADAADHQDLGRPQGLMQRACAPATRKTSSRNCARFHAAVVDGRARWSNRPEHAARDMALLVEPDVAFLGAEIGAAITLPKSPNSDRSLGNTPPTLRHLLPCRGRGRRRRDTGALPLVSPPRGARGRSGAFHRQKVMSAATAAPSQFIPQRTHADNLDTELGDPFLDARVLNTAYSSVRRWASGGLIVSKSPGVLKCSDRNVRPSGMLANIAR